MDKPDLDYFSSQLTLLIKFNLADVLKAWEKAVLRDEDESSRQKGSVRSWNFKNPRVSGYIKWLYRYLYSNL